MPAKFLRNGDAFRDVARASAESGKKLNSESCECDQNDHVSSSQSQNTKKEVERGAARWRGRPGRGEDLGRGRDKNDRGAAVVGRDPSELGGARKGERNPKVIVEIERDCCSAVITGGFFCFFGKRRLLRRPRHIRIPRRRNSPNRSSKPALVASGAPTAPFLEGKWRL